MSNKTKNPEGKVPAVKLAAWQGRAISLAAISIVFMYFNIYCTDTLGIRPSVVGTILMLSKIVDSITDLLAGYLIDNTNSKWGKARPYEISIVFAWLFTVLLFSTGSAWGNTVKYIWIFVMYTMIFSVFSTFLNASESPYIIRAFGTKEAVTKVSSFTGIFVTFGSMAVSISFPILMGKLATSGPGWTKLILIYAIPLALIGMLRFFFVKEDFADLQAETEHVSLKEMLTMLRSNRYAWCIAGANGAMQFVAGLGAASYYFTWIVGDISKYSTLQIISIVSLLVMVIFPALIRRTSANFLIGVGAAIGVLGYILNFFAGSNMVLLGIAFLLTGIAVLPASYLRAILIMDTAKYNQWKGLPPMESTAAALTNFFGKIFQAFGAFIFGILMDLGGYDGTLAVQPDSAMNMIRLLYSFIPAIIMVVMLLCAFAYHSLDRQLPQIEAELKERKERNDRNDHI